MFAHLGRGPLDGLTATNETSGVSDCMSAVRADGAPVCVHPALGGFKSQREARRFLGPCS